MLSRELFPVLERTTYLNTARHAPLPTRAVAAGEALLQQSSAEGSTPWERWESHHDHVRAAAAQLMGSTKAAVGFTRSTTEALDVVARGLGLGQGDRVVLPADAFPSASLPFLALQQDGVEVTTVEPADPTEGLTVDDWRDAIGTSVSLVATTWVASRDGLTTDLSALAQVTHDAGGLLVVDAIQGLGLRPAAFAEWGVDAAAAGTFKWLLGVEGLAVTFLSRQTRGRLRRVQPGWYSELHGPGEDDVPDARWLLEGGAPNSLGLAVLGASLEVLLEAGVESTWRHVQTIRHRLTGGMRKLGLSVPSWTDDESRGSGIVLALPPSGVAAEAVHEALRSAGVVASPKADGVRLSVAGFNDEADVDRVLEALATADL